MIDPQAKAVHDVMTAGPPLDQLGVEGARAWGAQRNVPVDPPDERLAIVDQPVDGVPVRTYRLLGRGVAPVVVFVHGGGWVLGDLDGVDATCRALALAGDVAVVSVGYRLAPEAQYPLPLDDCVTVLRWVVSVGAAEGFDVDRVCVSGESSGGQLAAATCLRARAEGLPVSFQLLVCPVIDPAMDTDSWRQFGSDWLPVSSQMSWMWDLYAGSRDVRVGEPLVNLAAVGDLSGLPPTLILTAEYDPLRDEGEQYGRRLSAAGVTAEVRRIPGQVHTVFGLARTVDACRDALHQAAQDVGKQLRN